MHKHYNGLKTALLLGGMVGLLMLSAAAFQHTSAAQFLSGVSPLWAWVPLHIHTGTPINSRCVP